MDIAYLELQAGVWFSLYSDDEHQLIAQYCQSLNGDGGNTHTVSGGAPSSYWAW